MGIAERKERQRAGLRDQILAAARGILAREGFAGLTMRKIADAIEYSPGALYLHFRSRDEIARELCRQGYAQLVAAFQPALALPDPRRRLAALARAYVQFGLDHPAVYRLIFMEDPRYTGAVFEADTDGGGNPGADAFTALTGTLDALKSTGQLDPAIDIQLMAELWWASVHGMVSLALTCPVFPVASIDAMLTLMDANLFPHP